MEFDKYPVTIILIAANVIFSIIGFSNSEVLTKTIGWPYYEKRNNQYYRFITSGFVHADWMHLIFNMFTLFFFGQNIEFIFSLGLGGNAAYLGLYFFGLIAGNIPSYIKHRDDYNYRSLGASGAVSAVVFASIIFTPWSTIQLYGVISMSAVVFAVLYVVYCIYMGKRNLDNIGHDAHLWGSMFGLVFTFVLIAAMRSDLFPYILNDFKAPSLFGRSGWSSALTHLLNSR